MLAAFQGVYDRVGQGVTLARDPLLEVTALLGVLDEGPLVALDLVQVGQVESGALFLGGDQVVDGRDLAGHHAQGGQSEGHLSRRHRDPQVLHGYLAHLLEVLLELLGLHRVHYVVRSEPFVLYHLDVRLDHVHRQTLFQKLALLPGLLSRPLCLVTLQVRFDQLGVIVLEPDFERQLGNDQFVVSDLKLEGFVVEPND